MSFDRLAATVICAAAFFIVACEGRSGPSALTAGGKGGDGRGGSTGGAGAAGTWGARAGSGGSLAGVAGHAIAGASGSWGGGAAGTGGAAAEAGTTGGAATAGAAGTATGGAGAGGPATGAAGGPATGAAGAPAGTAGGAMAGAGGPATGAAGRSMGGAGGTATPVASPSGTIVPLYTDPDHSSWAALVAAKAAHPTVGIIAVINPNSGPGSSAQADYTAGIAKLIAANIRVIGYVGTGYTAKTPAAVKAEMDRWKMYYPTLQGIFFDEQSNKAEHVAYYRDLSQYAKARGLSYTVGNPGSDTAESFVGAMDMMLIDESDGLPPLSRLQGWHANHAASNFGIIPYATAMDAAFVREARKHVGYIYLQNDDLPNPWDTLPSYFDDLLARSSNERTGAASRSAPRRGRLILVSRAARARRDAAPRAQARSHDQRDRAARDGLAVALGLFVVGQVRERADQIDDQLALRRVQVDELHAHAGVDVVVAAGAIGVHPHHAPFQAQLRAAGRREAQVQLGAGRLGRVGADEDAHRADVGDVREQEVVRALVVDLEVDGHAGVDAPVDAGAAPLR